MRKISLVIAGSIFFLAILLIFVYYNNTPITLDKTKIEKEIDSLLLPVYYQNITLDQLKSLNNSLKKDQYAVGEINEMAVMLKYHEYSHIGHSLGFLYEYVKTDTKPICPGHFLSHYYVYTFHEEKEYALSSLDEAKDNLPLWQSFMQSKDDKYLSENNYTYYNSLFNITLTKISKGINSTDNKTIYELADAPCAR